MTLELFMTGSYLRLDFRRSTISGICPGEDSKKALRINSPEDRSANAFGITLACATSMAVACRPSWGRLPDQGGDQMDIEHFGWTFFLASISAVKKVAFGDRHAKVASTSVMKR
jgi:hypothetical protein